MKAEEKIEAGPKPSPTQVSAGAIGISVPSKDESPVDQATGLAKKPEKKDPFPSSAPEPVEESKEEKL